ncbi:Copper amine oxidase N-terminal domain-containing protein [Paenibacillus algorifonticola]|uniref:Copper amine oxidase N-terminal domain-containing protein n=1 Tax=Paenibacillus algorifonticola TaxID=684063 RepID=A0A1I2B1Y7_9BACL|nr:trypsin-like peptidase domain-containing protein [Paenibacillus algorifonticola]SFE50192.1 Copper amine oxidase N-terminal domain-containing protein [Paenibacillus algorifonticola]
MKKIVFFILMISLLIPSATTSYAAEGKWKVYLDGTELTFSNSPFVSEGTTLVPFRNLFEALGATISYNGKTKTINAKKDNTEIILTINNPVAYSNGASFKLNVAPKAISGVTYVPLRFVSETLGYGIEVKSKKIYLNAGSTTTATPAPTTTPAPTSTPTPTPTDPTKTQDLTIEQIGELSDRVVYIEVVDQNNKAIASGSGVIVGAKGEIITNYHVIEGAHNAVIYTSDEAKYVSSTVLNVDKDRDLALIKIDSASLNLPTVTIGDSSKLKLGESVVAIGSPLGFTNSLTSGVVSTKSRVVDGQNYIQISTPIDHGSSGGALFNLRGELVGITTALVESSAAINLAIPSTDVSTFLKKPQQSKTYAAAAPGETASETTSLAAKAEAIEDYLNEEYSYFTFEGLELEFEWFTTLSKDKQDILIGGAMTDAASYSSLMKLQKKDDTNIPYIVQYIAEDLYDTLDVDNAIFGLYFDTYSQSYPSSYPADSIEREGSGYRVFHNFMLAIVDYNEGEMYYTLDPYGDDDLITIQI